MNGVRFVLAALVFVVAGCSDQSVAPNQLIAKSIVNTATSTTSTIAVSPTSVDFQFTDSSAADPQQATISVCNVGSGSIWYGIYVEGGASWLTLSASSGGPVGADLCSAVVLTANPAGLSPGLYTAQIVVQQLEPPCTTDADCDDGRSCVIDHCVPGTPFNYCTHTPDNSQCPDDGMFCNGTEFCSLTAKNLSGCDSTGDPCTNGLICDELSESCIEDECPDDPDKIRPGRCGCGVRDYVMDADFDCDVDLLDFRVFQLEFTGPK